MELSAADASRNCSIDRLAESNLQLLQKVAELEVAQARPLAHHDPLAGLPNRVLMLDRLERALLQAPPRTP